MRLWQHRICFGSRTARARGPPESVIGAEMGFQCRPARICDPGWCLRAQRAPPLLEHDAHWRCARGKRWCRAQGGALWQSSVRSRMLRGARSVRKSSRMRWRGPSSSLDKDGLQAMRRCDAGRTSMVLRRWRCGRHGNGRRRGLVRGEGALEEFGQ